MKNTKNTKIYPVASGLLSALLFGLAAPACKHIINGVNEFQLAGLLYLGAAIGVFPGILFNKAGNKSYNKKTIGRFSIIDFLKILGVVIFGGIAAPLLLLFGLKTAQASSVAIWLNFELVATALIGVIFFKEKLGKFGWIGVMFTFSAGFTLAVSQGFSSFMPALIIFCACVSWGIDNNLTAVIDCITPSYVTFIKGMFAGLINLTIGIFVLSPHFDVKVILTALLIGGLSYGASILLYIKSAQNIGATRAQILFAAAPVFSIVISVVFLNELFTVVQVIAVILIFSGVYFSTKAAHRHSHIHKKTEHVHEHSHGDLHHNHKHSNLLTDVKHTHSHIHEEIEHSHEHFPDIHHRHQH